MPPGREGVIQTGRIYLILHGDGAGAHFDAAVNLSAPISNSTDDSHSEDIALSSTMPTPLVVPESSSSVAPNISSPINTPPDVVRHSTFSPENVRPFKLAVTSTKPRRITRKRKWRF